MWVIKKKPEQDKSIKFKSRACSKGRAPTDAVEKTGAPPKLHHTDGVTKVKMNNKLAMASQ
jgi:hypothetical protein